MSKDQLAVLGGVPIRREPWPQWPRYDADTEAALSEVLRSQRWAISGPYRGKPSYERRFAAAFAKLHSVAFCTPVTNGSAGLALTLRALDVGYGDRVIVPGLTWIACATAVTSVGAIPVPADVNLTDLAISTDALRKALGQGAKAVILVHPFCMVADVEPLLTLCRGFGVPLIEDCSQAHGASRAGRRVGSFGVAGVFSMQQSKVLTSGEGGAVITDSGELAEKLEQLRADGRLFSTSPRMNALELTEVGAVQGRNHCLSEFQSAVLLSRLCHLDEENQTRRSNAARLDACLASIDGVTCLRPGSDVKATYYNYLMRLRRSAFGDRTVDDVAAALSSELSLQVSPIYRPIHRHRLFAHRVDPLLREIRSSVDEVLTLSQLPNCERARDEFISIPHAALLGGEQEISDIVRAVRKVQRHAARIPRFAEDNRAF